MNPNEVTRQYVKKHKREAGAVALMVVVLLVVLIGSASFVLDMGNLYRVRNELQNASDAASLAGADATSAPSNKPRAST